MTNSEKQAGKLWSWWSQWELKPVPKQSQKLAKHLSDEFVIWIPKLQNGVYFFLKSSDANILGKGGGLQDQVVKHENYSFLKHPLSEELTVKRKNLYQNCLKYLDLSVFL